MSFLDIVDFTRWSSQHSPRQLIESLNVLFSHFDREALQRGLEKIKTIGDCYMAVSGISDRGQDHVYRLLDFAVQAIRLAPEIAPGQRFELRVGINCGPAVAGVIGSHKFSFDVWGDVVNTASRLQTLARARHHSRLQTGLCLDSRSCGVRRTGSPGEPKGLLTTYLLDPQRNPSSSA